MGYLNFPVASPAVCTYGESCIIKCGGIDA